MGEPKRSASKPRQPKRTSSDTSVNRDVSKQAQIEASLREYQAILSAAEEVAKIGSWRWDLHTQKVTWSDEMFRLFGVERDGFDGDVSRIIAERIHPEDLAAVSESNRKVLEEANPVPMSYRIVLPDGTERTVWAQGKLVHDSKGRPQALTGFIQDITERVHAEKKVLQMKRLYATLSQVNQIIVRVKDREELFRTICEVAIQFGEFSLAWIGLLDEETGDIQLVSSTGPLVTQLPLPSINIHRDDDKNSLAVLALRTGRVVTSDNILTDGRIAQHVSNRFQNLPYRAAAVIPLRLRGKAIGALALLSQEESVFHDADEINLLEEMARDIAFALDNMENEEERRRAEQRIAHQAYLLENINDAVLATDASFQITSWNRSAEKLYGYSQEEVLGKTVQQVIRSEISDEQRAQIVEELKENGGYRLEVKQYHRDGHPFWVEGSTFTLRNANGEVAGYISINRDITERKKVEEALKRNEAVLRLFVEHSPASIAMFDREMRYIVASHRYFIDYRLNREDLTGISHYEIFPEIPERWKEIHRRCLNGAIERAEEDPFPREDGTLDWVRWEIRPWYEETGVIGGIILFSEVITERKQVQDELRVLNQQLEQRVAERTVELSHANRAKDEFLANMSHELRTPLNTVLGLSESLLEQRHGPLNEKQLQFVELITSSGRHLLGLINDILEVSKIEAGRLELRPTRIYVKEICDSSLNFIRELSLKKKISVEFRSDETLSTFDADPQRIKQILINLLTNAVKFTPEGGRITLDVHASMNREQIIFSVSDTGIGIAPDDIKKLFTPFSQLDSSLARQYAGTGLGLALVQKLTNLHGGSIEVESEVGKGSRFTVSLPLKSQSDPSSATEGEPVTVVQEPAPSSPVQPRGVILLAEDNTINSQMMCEYLEAQGYSVIVAQNGEEVLEKAAEIRPDIILMDIQMPKMDGLEATRLLRRDPRFTTTPIIALTALAMPGDKERCLEAGATEYLSKPVGLKQLQQLIQSLIEPKP